MERISRRTWVPPWILREHEARYAFVSAYTAGRIVVDCAAGEAEGTRVIAATGPRQVIALDCSMDAAIIARSLGFHTIVANAQQLPLRPGSVDVIVGLEMIEHLERPDDFIADAAQSLREAGVLICSTPNRVVSNPALPPDGRPVNPFHNREYDRDQVCTLMRQHFARVALYGQAPQRPFMMETLERIAAVVGLKFAARLRQLSKTPLAVVPRRRRYPVRPYPDGCEMEFVVTVCNGRLS